jgi:hypothetical protein
VGNSRLSDKVKEFIIKVITSEFLLIGIEILPPTMTVFSIIYCYFHAIFADIERAKNFEVMSKLRESLLVL